MGRCRIVRKCVCLTWGKKAKVKRGFSCSLNNSIASSTVTGCSVSVCLCVCVCVCLCVCVCVCVCAYVLSCHEITNSVKKTGKTLMKQKKQLAVNVNKPRNTESDETTHTHTHTG